MPKVPKIEKDEKINFAADPRGLTQTLLFPPPTWRRKTCLPFGQDLEKAPATFPELKALFSIEQRFNVFGPAGRGAERPSQQDASTDNCRLRLKNEVRYSFP
jgi:hypothetical protein